MIRDARRRLDDLLLSRATEGLDAAAAQELERLLAAAKNDVDTEVYEQAAAAVCLAVLGGARVLPSGLRARLERSAAEFVLPRPVAER